MNISFSLEILCHREHGPPNRVLDIIDHRNISPAEQFQNLIEKHPSAYMCVGKTQYIWIPHTIS